MSAQTSQASSSSSSSTSSTRRHEQPWMHGAAGMLGGALAMTLFYPLDFLRTRMHTLHQGTRALPMRSVREIVQAGNLHSMYRGLCVAVVSHSVGWGTYLVTFRAAQRRCDALLDSNNSSSSSTALPSSVRDFVSACVAATVTGTLITPLHVVKTRRQLCRLDGASSSSAAACHGSLRQLLRAMVREEGYAALYKGLGPQILLTGNTTLQVTLYEALRRRFFSNPDDPAPWQVALASAASKAVSTALFNPLEVVRTRVQDSRNAHTAEYRSLAAGLRTLWRSEGAAGLYRGLPVNVARVIPSTVAAFVLYEKCLWLIRSVHTRVTHGSNSDDDDAAVVSVARSNSDDDDGGGGVTRSRVTYRPYNMYNNSDNNDDVDDDRVLTGDVRDVALVGMCTRRPPRRHDAWADAGHAATPHG